MASPKPFQRLIYTCASCARHSSTRKHFSTTTTRLHADTSSHLPRVASPSLWASLIPKPFRRPSSPLEEAERARQKAERAARPRTRNPYTIFIVLALVVGSNAINTIALRNEMLNFSRKTDARIELLREVIQKVRNGEEVDVRRVLGTGDPAQEAEWEEVIREMAETDALWESKKRRDRLKAEREVALEKEAKVKDGTGSGGDGESGNAGSGKRPKFIM